MHIYTRGGSLPFDVFSFPDGQRTFKLLATAHDDLSATIEASIQTGDQLLDVLLAKDVLDANGYITSLDLRYLSGRMDRRVTLGMPFTLQVVARMIMAAGFRKIRVLDPHSPVTLTLLNAAAVYPMAAVQTVLSSYHPNATVVISPDNGATLRTRLLAGSSGFSIRQGRKHRNVETGDLSHFTVDDGSFLKGKDCVILDDICDGGGTFVGLSAVLRLAGARHVDLFVTHGIFSKGLPLPGIRTIYTTDSLLPRFVVADPAASNPALVTIPVSMKDLT